MRDAKKPIEMGGELVVSVTEFLTEIRLAGVPCIGNQACAGAIICFRALRSALANNRSIDNKTDR